jgi:ubiquitin thioesterase protein OTUB1
VQITALARALRLNVSVAYLDGHADDVDFVDFANAEGERPLVLLYRCARPLRRAREMLMRF